MTVGLGHIIQSLHQACQTKPLDYQTIQHLVQTMPAAVEFRSQDEWLPLHRACRRQPSLRIIQTLVEAWPASIREWTNDGVTEARLPIHLACQYGASLEVVAYLVEQDPTCVQAVSPKQVYTALDFALYYYHQRRQENLDVTEAEKVLKFLSNVRVQDKQDRTVKDKEQKDVPLPAVRALPVSHKEQETPTPKEERPHIMTVPSSPHVQDSAVYHPPRLSCLPPRGQAMPLSKPATSGKSKIIRMKLPRPSIPLR